MNSFPRRHADYSFIIAIGILIVFGFVMLLSASAPFGRERFGDGYFFIKRQFLFGLIPGIISFFACANLPYQTLKKIAFPAFLASTFLLLAVFIPGLGANYGTRSASWLSAFGYSFQPAEIAKLSLALFLALYLSGPGNPARANKERFFFTLLLAGIPLFLVLIQPDIGTVAVLFCILFGMLFLAHAPLPRLGLLALAGILAFVALIIAAPYRAARFTTFLHPELDPAGVGYHINQAFLAIGSGGFFGRGYGQSVQKFQYLPEVHADSVFAIIAEEMGFIVAAGLIMLLLYLCHRGYTIARQAPDEFGRLLTGGVIVWIASQSFFNIGAMIGLLPLTGIPLPLVSHGGTAFAVTLAALGMVVNVSKHATV